MVVESDQQLTLALERPLAPDAIDRAVLRNGDDPGAGIGGGAVARPALYGEREGVLDRLLSALEIAERAGQDRDGAPPLLPEDGLDVGYGRASAGTCSTGRTSTDPCREPGSFAAQAVASSSVSASIR